MTLNLDNLVPVSMLKVCPGDPLSGFVGSKQYLLPLLSFSDKYRVTVFSNQLNAEVIVRFAKYVKE